MCDRLVDKGLIRRGRLASDRRMVRVSLKSAGRELVETATRHRRRDLAAVLGRLSPEQRQAVVSALAIFADAAGETALPEDVLAADGPDLSPFGDLQSPV